MNKKGYYHPIGGLWVIPLIFGLLFLVIIGGVGYEIWLESGIECDYYLSSVLKSVGGLEDIDTGLFAGGTIKEKTLMFENGLVITISSQNLNKVILKLGKKYRIFRCESNGGTLSYKIK